MGKKKHYIDRKSAITLHLVHRSQHDPHFVDQKAPQSLLEANCNMSSTSKQLEMENNGNANGLHLFEKRSLSYESETHLPGNEDAYMKLSSAVLKYVSIPTDKRRNQNRATPILGLERNVDVVTRLDEDFHHSIADNKLDDELVLKAINAVSKECNFDADLNSIKEESKFDKYFDQRGDCFPAIKSKSYFPECSTSSSTQRTKKVILLDDQFENVYKSYEDGGIGQIHLENTEGTEGRILADDYFQSLKDKEASVESETHYLKNISNIEGVENEVFLPVGNRSAESATFGNAANLTANNSYSSHVSCYPRTIDESRINRKIQVDTRNGLRIDTRQGISIRLTGESLMKLNKNYPAEKECKLRSCHGDSTSMLSVLSHRPKDETSEERCKRKRLLKEYRAERRIERKVNTLAYKDENLRQQKVYRNVDSFYGSRIF